MNLRQHIYLSILAIISFVIGYTLWHYASWHNDLHQFVAAWFVAISVVWWTYMVFRIILKGYDVLR